MAVKSLILTALSCATTVTAVAPTSVLRNGKTGHVTGNLKMIQHHDKILKSHHNHHSSNKKLLAKRLPEAPHMSEHEHAEHEEGSGEEHLGDDGLDTVGKVKSEGGHQLVVTHTIANNKAFVAPREKQIIVAETKREEVKEEAEAAEQKSNSSHSTTSHHLKVKSSSDSSSSSGSSQSGSKEALNAEDFFVCDMSHTSFVSVCRRNAPTEVVFRVRRGTDQDL